MRLQIKFAIYNALSKALIIAAFGAALPVVVEKVVYNHIDKRLIARSERVMKIIQRGGINDIIAEQDCSFESYSILKEEFVAIRPILSTEKIPPLQVVRNEEWMIEGESMNHRIIRKPFVYDNQLYELNIGEGLSTVDQLKTTILRFSLYMMIGVVLLSIFIDLGFVRILLRPFNRIVTGKLQTVISPTSFNYTPVRSSTYEFNQLDHSINDMMQKIRDAFLIEKEFISNVSHELQTPISILQNRLENIIVDEKVPEEITLKLIESQKTLTRMSKIIKALLLISKIENDQYLKNESVKIVELLDEVLEEIEERLQQRNIQLVKQFYDDLTYAPCNRTLIFTLFFNIINNAIKYNKDGGSIIISTQKTETNFTVEIRDTGIGIDDSQVKSIFDRFKRLNQSTAEGYGLGLPIVKTIAAFHQIDIKVESKPDMGTVFKLTF